MGAPSPACETAPPRSKSNCLKACSRARIIQCLFDARRAIFGETVEIKREILFPWIKHAILKPKYDKICAGNVVAITLKLVKRFS